MMRPLGGAPRAVFVQQLSVGLRVSARLPAPCVTLSAHHTASTKPFSKHPAVSHPFKDPR